MTEGQIIAMKARAHRAAYAVLDGAIKDPEVRAVLALGIQCGVLAVLESLPELLAEGITA